MMLHSFRSIVYNHHQDTDMKNLRAITKYIDVKAFKPRPLDLQEEQSLAKKLHLFAKNINKLSYTFKFPR